MMALPLAAVHASSSAFMPPSAPLLTVAQASTDNSQTDPCYQPTREAPKSALPNSVETPEAICSNVLGSLSLEDCLPALNDNPINLTTFITMTSVRDFARITIPPKDHQAHTHAQCTDTEACPQSARSFSDFSVASSSVETPVNEHASQSGEWCTTSDTCRQRHQNENQRQSVTYTLDRPKQFSTSPPPLDTLPSLNSMSADAPSVPNMPFSYAPSQNPPPYANTSHNLNTCLTRCLSPQYENPTKLPRPQSLPLYLLDDDLCETDRSVTPPPEYLEPNRAQRCCSYIIPREEQEEEGNEELPAYKCTVYKMGYVYIKREMDKPGIRTRWRIWRKFYLELWGTLLRVYVSKYGAREWIWGKPRRCEAINVYSMAGADAGRALDYTRRPNVLRLTIARGPQMLLRLSDNVDMISWIEHLQAAINISLDLEYRPMPRFVTLPLRSSGHSPQSPRLLAIEHAREQRRRQQTEMLI